jgi:thiol-disulfide isomerase/thioredoxin
LHRLHHFPMTATPRAAQFRNLAIVLVAIVLSLALFLGLKKGTKTDSLEALAARAVPIDVALKSGKPTIMEFYANWCGVCQAMAKDMNELEQQYGDRINFVMLNVDNNKWLPEMMSYKVDGIPHFVFLDKKGEAIASTIGEQPRPVMAGNIEAMINGAPLPYLQSRGRRSERGEEATARPNSVPQAQTDPRSHGAQVVPAS